MPGVLVARVENRLELILGEDFDALRFVRELGLLQREGAGLLSVHPACSQKRKKERKRSRFS